MTVEEAVRPVVIEDGLNHRPDWASDHVGRSFEGHELEDDCPCAKAPCGLVISDEIRTDCRVHHDAKSMRQGHSKTKCSGAP